MRRAPTSGSALDQHRRQVDTEDCCAPIDRAPEGRAAAPCAADWRSDSEGRDDDMAGGAIGHDDTCAALIYQRATSDADRLIAESVSALVDEHRGQANATDDEDDDGAAGALVPVA